MKYVILILVILLLILHQDFWFWEDDTLVLGFMPIGLFYHACLSIAAATVWFLATRFAWPHELEVDPGHESKDNPSHGEEVKS